MKITTKLLSICLLIVSTITLGQSKVEASDIMNDIKNGKTISYNNVTISGVLDFTFMDDALEKLPKRKRSWWGNNGNNKVEKIIDVSISFTNCTFEDDVLAYIPDEDSKYTFTASFREKVIFKNCKLEGKAMFKYSDFEELSDFSGTEFSDDNTFKYAKFLDDTNFENTLFTESTTFKYAKFSNKVSFKSAIFEDFANFKYAKFYEGVSFEKVNFEEDLDIKYMEVSGDFNISKMKVGFDIDSKYTKINGKSFNKYLVSNMN